MVDQFKARALTRVKYLCIHSFLYINLYKYCMQHFPIFDSKIWKKGQFGPQKLTWVFRSNDYVAIKAYP